MGRLRIIIQTSFSTFFFLLLLFLFSIRHYPAPNYELRINDILLLHYMLDAYFFFYFLYALRTQSTRISTDTGKTGEQRVICNDIITGRQLKTFTHHRRRRRRRRVRDSNLAVPSINTCILLAVRSSPVALCGRCFRRRKRGKKYREE